MARHSTQPSPLGATSAIVSRCEHPSAMASLLGGGGSPSMLGRRGAGENVGEVLLPLGVGRLVVVAGRVGRQALEPHAMDVPRAVGPDLVDVDVDDEVVAQVGP